MPSPSFCLLPRSLIFMDQVIRTAPQVGKRHTDCPSYISLLMMHHYIRDTVRHTQIFNVLFLLLDPSSVLFIVLSFLSPYLCHSFSFTCSLSHFLSLLNSLSLLPSGYPKLLMIFSIELTKLTILII